MKLVYIFLGLLLLLACKKTVETNERLPADTLVKLVDTVSKPIDTPVKPIDTTKMPIDTIKYPPAPNINYLALGDSYTIGEAVGKKENFPSQLVKQLELGGLVINPPRILAQTGWTTSELQEAFRNSGIIEKYHFVTLLIGVNNQYRGQSQETYRKEFKELLQTAISSANDNKAHVFVISIPDWGVTPYGKSSGRDLQTIAREIDAFNAINKEETLAEGVSYTDITPGSRMAATDLSLVASDGLHPSGKMYANWAIAVAPAIIKAFK